MSVEDIIHDNMYGRLSDEEAIYRLTLALKSGEMHAFMASLLILERVWGNVLPREPLESMDVAGHA